uniref:Uncharacterized protein n=1 Tax=Anguilla anguilla TaxID=7936 RepID=A0A0E9UZV1_ANGAN
MVYERYMRYGCEGVICVLERI